jgi:hypothetical protein
MNLVPGVHPPSLSFLTNRRISLSSLVLPNPSDRAAARVCDATPRMLSHLQATCTWEWEIRIFFGRTKSCMPSHWMPAATMMPTAPTVHPLFPRWW